jgi:hypothetical protein
LEATTGTNHGRIDAQAGFYYQNVLGALRAIDLIEIGSPLLSVSFDNPSRADATDDIVAEGKHHGGISIRTSTAPASHGTCLSSKSCRARAATSLATRLPIACSIRAPSDADEIGVAVAVYIRHGQKLEIDLRHLRE